MRIDRRRLPVLAFAIILISLSGPNRAAAFQDDAFNQAVAAYNQNHFAEALAQFKRVSGPHAQESAQYIGKINSYQDAMSVAKGIMDRSADERDANSLAYAIQQFEKAIAIKPDGPWNPADQLARARALKAEFEKAHASASKTMDSDYCAKALAAAQKHHYTEASQFICAVANDNPAYSCGGDEAVHLCQLDTEMEKLDNISEPVDTKRQPPPNPVPSQPSDAFDKARAAYDSNDFDRARALLARVDANAKPAAGEYLRKISNYKDFYANGEKSSRAGDYQSALGAFNSAAAIKPDGPGTPQIAASRMELFLGLDKFYSGDYAAAIQHLQNCAQAGLQKQTIVHFYLGASELGKYFLSGNEDPSLRQQGVSDLLQAKQAGYTPAQDVSPKILRIYKDLAD